MLGGLLDLVQTKSGIYTHAGPALHHNNQSIDWSRFSVMYTSSRSLVYIAYYCNCH